MLREAISEKLIRVARGNINRESVGFYLFRVSEQHPFGVNYGHYGCRFAWVDFIFVEESWRSRKIATRLYDDLEAHCRNIDVQEIMLDVYNHNTTSFRFHEKQGFKPIVTIFTRKVKGPTESKL